MEVKIKEWKLITDVEKVDNEKMKAMKALYETNIQDCLNDTTYVKIVNQIFRNEQKIEKAVEAERKRKEKELSATEKQLSKAQIKEKSTFIRRTSDLDLQELIDKFDFYMTCTGALTWYYRLAFQDEYGNRDWKSLKKETLQANFAATDVFIRGGEGEPDYSSIKEFQKMLSDQGRIFSNVIQSYTKSSGNGKLNIMNRNFCPPAADTDIKYHWFFDALIESLSGSQEDDTDDKNPFQHFQKVLIGKYQHPENIFLPALIINDKGSTGKGIFGAKFLMTLFAGNVADNCTIEHLTGKFNGLIAGKAVIFINETAKEKVDAGRVKAFIGSPTFMVENKFETPYSCDNTALVISATNESAGAISLEGTNSDRRFSIFSPKGDLYGIVARYRMNTDGEKSCTLDDADRWIKTVGQHLLSDPSEVGKWVTAMTLKYGDVSHVVMLGGDAYQNMIERQRAGWLDTVDDIFSDSGFSYIREQLLRDLVKEYNKSEKYIPGRKKMVEEIERLIKDRGYNIELKDRVKIYESGTSTKSIYVQRTVWRKTDLGNITEDESQYCGYDNNQRLIWTYKG